MNRHKGTGSDEQHGPFPPTRAPNARSVRQGFLKQGDRMQLKSSTISLINCDNRKRPQLAQDAIDIQMSSDQIFPKALPAAIQGFTW
jgi:hypothetical protein